MPTPQIDHYATATLALDHVDAARVALAEEYADHVNGHRKSVVADLHHRIGLDLKLADIHATLALAGEVATLVEDFRQARGPRQVRL